MISQTKRKMENQVVMNKVIMKAVAEVTIVMIQAFTETQSQRPEHQCRPKLGGPALRQPQFNWEATDKYTEWKAFILEVRNVLSTYNAQDQDKIAIVKNWLGRRGLHYLESLTEAEKWESDTLQGLSDILSAKFKPQFNKTIKLLQFRKLYRFEGKSAEEWMGRLQVGNGRMQLQKGRQTAERAVHTCVKQ